MGHGIKIYGIVGTGNIAASGDTDATTTWEFPSPFIPTDGLPRFFKAFFKTTGGDPQIVQGHGVGLEGVSLSDRNGVDAEVGGDTVKMDFEGKARTHAAMTPECATGRFVGKDAHSVKAIGRENVGQCQQLSGIVERNETIGTVGTAVEKVLKFKGRDGPILLDPGLELHMHRMASPVSHEDLLPGVDDLHRLTALPRKHAGNKFKGEWFTLTPEAPAQNRFYNPDSGHRHFQDTGKRLVDIMRHLCRGPDRHFAVAIVGQCHMCFYRGMGYGRLEKGVFPDVVRCGKAIVNIPEFKCSPPFDICHFTYMMDLDVLPRHGFMGV